MPATEEEAERLDTRPGIPMLEIAQVGFLDDGTPFEYSVSRYEGTRGELREVNVVVARDLTVCPGQTVKPSVLTV